ncbi:MAG: T9SS type A sorting domain-containing protein [Pseudobacter sp.]|uniref:T9SS type A sorting domain-containing protein n=1 Tax=Pseudobacter sp. TaxID=2045420 RepID=UPI003F7E48D2
MKKISGLFLVCGIISTISRAQTPYPTPPADKGNITQMEYFIDTDPGFGNGRPIPVTAVRDLASFSMDIDLTGLNRGWHRLFIRSRNASGNWSHPSVSVFDNVGTPAYPAMPAPAPSLAAMEYYVDTDPGFGNGINVPLPAASDISNITIPVDLTLFPKGIHRLFVRTKDSQGRWSLSHISLFDNGVLVPYPTAPAAPAPISNMEYFFDTDPGFGNGRPISFTGNPDINQLSVDVDLTGLSAGNHTFFLRSKEFPWSLTMAVSFSYITPLPVTWLYVRGERKLQQALINWATAQESETDKFIVEYSRNGQQYSSVGEVAAAGNSSTTTKYAFTYPQLQPGVNYFRLKQLDKNGHYTYSSIMVIPYVDNHSDPVLMPNPVVNTATLLIPPAIEAEQLTVFDASGKAVWQQQVSNRNQSQLLQLDKLPKGVYVLNVRAKSQHYNIRFVKN